MALEFPFSDFLVSHREPILPSKLDAYEDSLQQGYKKNLEKIAAFDFIKLLFITRDLKENKKASHTLRVDIYNAYSQYRIHILYGCYMKNFYKLIRKAQFNRKMG